MRAHRPVILVFLLAAVAAGCASGGAVPRPQPFPGAGSRVAEREPPARAEGVSLTPTPVLATALAQRGVPYRNGGNSPTSGFDCSGFVQWVFAQHGAWLPRETRDQFDEGRRVDRREVQPGDLVFFSTVSRGASHVGIALGDGRFVHAPSSRGVVRVERYSNGYWASRWVGARRITAPEIARAGRPSDRE